VEKHLKQRLLGTVILVSVAVIVLPLVLDGSGYKALQERQINAPPAPAIQYHKDGFTDPLREGLLQAPTPIEIKEHDAKGDAANTLVEQSDRYQQPPERGADKSTDTAAGTATDAAAERAAKTASEESAKGASPPDTATDTATDAATDAPPDATEDDSAANMSADTSLASPPKDTSKELPQDDGAAKAATVWVLQVGSFSVEANAVATHKNLQAMDMQQAVVELNSEQIKGQKVYVVKISSSEYEALSKIANRIKKDYPDAFIKERL